MPDWVAAIDCGTATIKAAVIASTGAIRGLAAQPCPCTFAADARVTFDPRMLADNSLAALQKALAQSGVAANNIAAIAVTNQRATLLCIGADGEPAGAAISWQDMRGTHAIRQLRRQLADSEYYRITGLPNDPVFTLGKILALREMEPDIHDRISRFVLVHDFILRQLGCDDFYCDWSNASLTGMFDLETLDWSSDILAAARLTPAQLPLLVHPAKQLGTLSDAAARRTGLLAGTPLISGGGDQQCAGLGAGAVRPGIVEITLGTAAVPLCFAPAPKRDPNRGVMCCAHAVPGAWELEGLQNAAGSCVEWAARAMIGTGRFQEEFFQRVARIPAGSHGALFYPYLAGASAPHWNPTATGTFLGLSLGHDAPTLMRAIFEGVSMQTREILQVFAKLNVPLQELRLTGGWTTNNLWNQIQADIYGLPVSTLAHPHATALGAAILAAKGVGMFASFEDAVDQMVHLDRTFQPDPERAAYYHHLYRRYVEIYHNMDRNGLFAAVKDSEN